MRRISRPAARRWWASSSRRARRRRAALAVVARSYYVDASRAAAAEGVTKLDQGVIWGKDVKHYKKGEVPAALKAAAELAPLHSTLAQAAVKHDRIQCVRAQCRRHCAASLALQS